MLYRYLAALVIAGVLPAAAYACDACGCGIGGGGFGLLSVYRNNYVGLTHGYVPFRSRLTSGEYTGTEDIFHTTELFLRYEPLFRVRADVFLPYRHNLRRGPAGDQSLSGLGDVRLGLSYVLTDGQPLGIGLWSVYWEAGLTASLPTGRYEDDLLDSHYLPDNFTPGKGALSLGAQTALVLSNGKWGLAVNARHQRYGKSTAYYRFGAETEAGVRVFGQFVHDPHWKIIPYLGISREHTAANSTAGSQPVHATGGASWLAAAGVNVRYDDLTLAVHVAQPLESHYSDGLAEAGLRATASVLYNF
ncbi:hypothetical protein [Lewinella sp. IMCC34191]|uniref:hypothetical protein n=1 Tax=Lewinella sp. IMCC34191 TaxID=2259172 RepID=UPI000E262853|nr:hypothetical protein [Lewinella sp. IMCC34191]